MTANIRMSGFVSVLVTAGLLLQCGEARGDDWPQFGRDGSRNAVSSERRPPTTWDIGNPGRRINDTQRNIKWSARLGSNTFGDPLIVVELTGYAHCLDARTGQHHWKADLWAACYTSPLIVDNKVYVAKGDGDVAVFGLSPDPGLAMRRVHDFQPLRVNMMDSSISCSPIYANGVLYITTRSELFAITAGKDDSELVVATGHWPQWRGQDRDNRSPETGLLKEWPDGGPPFEWRVDGIGEGIAAVSIEDGRIFTLGYFDDGEFLTALDQVTGERLWATRLGPKVNESPLMRWLSQRSPTVDDDRVYAITSGGRLACLRVRDGSELWSKSYPDDYGATRHYWGFCDYPLVDGERLICSPGGPQATVVALDKRTGREVWRSVVSADGAPQSMRSAYAATVVTEVGNVRQYVVFLSGALVGLRASDGKLLWKYDRISNRTANSHTPIVRGDQILVCNGYGTGLAMLKLTVTNGKFEAREQYFESLPLDPFQDNSLLVGDHLFESTAGGVVACFNGTTGQKAWGPIRLKERGRVAMIFAADRLYVRQAEGRVTLADASPTEFIERGSFQIPDAVKSAGATFPVVAGGRLYLRDENKLLCYDIRADAPSRPRAEPRTIVLAAPKAGPAPEPRERTLRSIFVPTPQDVVERMLELAEVKKPDVVFDLGSGDGRIVITAAKKYGCKAIGYELDKQLVELSRTNAETAGVKSLVTIEPRDLFTADLSTADVIAVFLLPQQLEKLLPQLKKLKPGVRIVSHQFAIPDVPPDKTVKVESKDDGDEHTIHLWTTPLR